MTTELDNFERMQAVMQLNELSTKDTDVMELLAEAARKARLIAAKKQIRYGVPLQTLNQAQTV